MSDNKDDYDEWAQDLEELKASMQSDTCEKRYIVQVAVLSILAMIVMHICFASILALVENLSVFVPYWIHHYNLVPHGWHHVNSKDVDESIAEILSEVSILLCIGPAYGIGWAKAK
jgi:hypothetical protein